MQNQKLKSVPWFNCLTYGRCYAFLRIVAIIMLIVGMFVLCVKSFAHTHLEVEINEAQWQQIEKEDKQQAYERVQKDPENASDSDKRKSGEHEWKNMG